MSRRRAPRSGWCRWLGGWLASLVTASVLAAPSTAVDEPDPLQRPRLQSVGVGAIPRGVIATLTQDRQGFLWLATGDGLMRYDGYRFRAVELDHPDPAARNLGWIRALLADRDGRLWIGTEAQALAVYDPRTDRVELRPLRTGASAASPLLPAVRALAQTPDGVVWVGTQGGGLWRHRPHQDHTEPAPASPQPHVLALATDGAGTLWLGGPEGLMRLDAAHDRFVTVPGPKAVQSLQRLGDGTVWVGGADGELWRLEPSSRRLHAVPRAAAGSGAITAIAQDARGRVWVGHGRGVELRDPRTGALIQHLQHDPRQPSGLAANEVTGLLLDHSATIWVAGLGVGLQRALPDQRGLRTRGADTHAASPMAEPSARSVLALADGGLWVGVAGRGVAVLDAGLRTRATLSVDDGRPVQGMARGPGGQHWLATPDALLELDSEGRERRRLAGVGPVHRLTADSRGRLWLCGERGLFVLAPGAAQLQPVPMDDGQASGEVFVVAESPDGRLLAGTSLGLDWIEPSDGGHRLRRVPTGGTGPLGNPVVIGLLFDRRGGLWVDTAVTGLHRLQRWEGTRPVFDRVSVRLGSVGRPFGVNLLDDEQGRIWTQQHVYDPARDRLQTLGPADGRDIGTGWFHAYARMADGRMVFGGSQGLLVVDPKDFVAQDTRPPLVLTELRVNGERHAAGPAPAALTLTPDARSFSVEFAALEYEHPDRLRYAYRLEGYDPDWLLTNPDRRLASYGSLEPGGYVLRVRAANSSGLWTPAEWRLPVTVVPPWWRTAWARAALGLLLVPAALAVLGVAVRVRTAQLERQRGQLESLVQDRTAALEQAVARLRDASTTDPLTGLHNRRHLAEAIEADVAHSLREAHRGGDEPLLFMLIDVDHFKRVNDAHGHAAGDAVLVAVAQRLKRVFRDGDRLVRWGGEEFLAVARGAPRDDAPSLATRLCDAVAGEPVRLPDGAAITCTVSVGWACLPLLPDQPRALDWQATVALADAALYAAKAEGRNRWVGVPSASARPVDGGPVPDARWLLDPGVRVQRGGP